MFLSFTLFGCMKEHKESETVQYGNILYTENDMKPVNGKVYQHSNERYLIGEFKNGLREGIHQNHQGDQLIYEGEYQKGIPIGIHTEWHPDGELFYKKRYVNGIGTGTTKYWSYWSGKAKVDSISSLNTNGTGRTDHYGDKNQLFQRDFYKAYVLLKKEYFYDNNLIKKQTYTNNHSHISYYQDGRIVYYYQWKYKYKIKRIGYSE